MALIFSSKNQIHFQSQFIDKVGNTIRNHLINLKRHKSLDQNKNMFLDSIPSKNISEGDFIANNYATQKNKWRISKNCGFNMIDKTSIPQQKKQLLQQFKASLKSKLHRKKQLQQLQNFYAHERIKQMKSNTQYNKQQKKSIHINRRKKQIQLMKSILQRSKGEMNMRKRQKELQLSFTKWERAEHKFRKLTLNKMQN